MKTQRCFLYLFFSPLRLEESHSDFRFFSLFASPWYLWVAKRDSSFAVSLFSGCHTFAVYKHMRDRHQANDVSSFTYSGSVSGSAGKFFGSSWLRVPEFPVTGWITQMVRRSCWIKRNNEREWFQPFLATSLANGRAFLSLLMLCANIAVLKIIIYQLSATPIQGFVPIIYQRYARVERMPEAANMILSRVDILMVF